MKLKYKFPEKENLVKTEVIVFFFQAKHIISFFQSYILFENSVYNQRLERTLPIKQIKIYKMFHRKEKSYRSSGQQDTLVQRLTTILPLFIYNNQLLRPQPLRGCIRGKVQLIRTSNFRDLILQTTNHLSYLYKRILFEIFLRQTII